MRLLNLKAQTLGAYSGEITNTHGLPEEEHLISAYDLAQISRYAMKNKVFRNIVSLPKAKISGGYYNRVYKNTNRLLLENPFIIGIKTGTTNQAGPCLVSAMEKEGKMLIAVVFNSPSRYEESLAVLNYGMEEFIQRKIISKGDICGYAPVLGAKKYLPLKAATDGIFLSPRENSGLKTRFKLPAFLPRGVEPGQIVGSLDIEDALGNTLWAIDIAAGESIKDIR